MTPTPSGPHGERDRHDDHRPPNQLASNRTRHTAADRRIRRYLSLGIPVVTVAVLGIYVLVWLLNNADPALRASPADQQVVGQVTSIPQSTWQRIGTGGLSNPWRHIG